ncbi:MAG TPA: sodium:solute symporter [Oculatellaceae cyanobacterium]
MHFDAALIVDLLVIVGYFVAVVYVGLTFGERENSLEDFALGGRSMPWWAVLASIIAAETSAATFLGTPGEGFSLVSYAYLQIAVGTVLGRIVVASLFIKKFYDLNVYSIYEFLQSRFGPGTRKIASATFLLTRVLASGARLYVAAIVLAVGFSLFTGSQPTTAEQLAIYIGSILLITLITAVYTSVGGIKAVIWTDCIQSAVMFGGACAAIIVIIAKLPGGLTSLQSFLSSTPLPVFVSGTTSGANLSANLKQILTTDYTIWAALLGSVFTTLATHGTDQDMVQRMLTATDYKKSQLSLVLSGLADIPIGFIFLTIGILLHLFFQLQPDQALPAKNSEVFAYFILKQMPVGLRGLLVAGIFATSMGSLSAALNALATTFTRDWSSSGKQDSGKQSVRTARIFTYVFAALMIVVATATAYFVIEHPDSRIIPIVLGIFGYTYGSLLGVFLLGLVTKNRGCDEGNYVAMLGGFIVVGLSTGLFKQLFDCIGLTCPPLLAEAPVIAFPWRIMIGALTTLLIGALFSSKKTTESMS